MRRSRTICLGLFLGLAGAACRPAPSSRRSTRPSIITSAEGTPPLRLLAARPDGTWLVVWTTELPTAHAVGRFLGPGGHRSPSFEIAAGPIESAAVALLRTAASWPSGSTDDQILGSRHDRDGRVRVPTFPVASEDPVLIRTEPGVAVGADGEWMVVWREAELPPTGFDLRIMGRRFGPDGTPTSDPVRALSEQTYDGLSDPEVAAAPGGGFLAVWALDWEPNITPIGETSNYVTRHIDADGNLGPSTELSWGKEESRLTTLPGDRGFLLAQQGSDLVYSQAGPPGERASLGSELEGDCRSST